MSKYQQKTYKKLANLACYYALNKKQSMLLAITQAIKLGKKTEQFLKDSDFKAYFEDEDFISVLKRN
ncbi:MAG: TPR end-of-group domain-containing protein [Poseidonibacter sp.]